MSVAAIILAAGASRRLGQPKQLLQVHGETLIARTARIAREAGAVPVFVVLGAEAEKIRAVLSASDVVLVENTQWQSGLSSSVRAGVEAVEAQSASVQGVLLLNCDQPRLNADHLRAMIAAFEARKQEVLVVSTYAGVQGVPAVLPRDLFGELKLLTGDKGAKSLFSAHLQSIAAVPFEGGEVDIDTPDDLAHLA